MTTLDKRLDKLEAVIDPPKIKPLIIYTHMTAAECAKFNKPPIPGNPLMVIVRPISENERQDE